MISYEKSSSTLKRVMNVIVIHVSLSTNEWCNSHPSQRTVSRSLLFRKSLRECGNAGRVRALVVNFQKVSFVKISFASVLAVVYATTMVSCLLSYVLQ